MVCETRGKCGHAEATVPIVSHLHPVNSIIVLETLTAQLVANEHLMFLKDSWNPNQIEHSASEKSE